MGISSPHDDSEDYGMFRMDPEAIPTNMIRIIQSVAPRWLGGIFTFEMVCQAMGVKKTDPDLHDYAVAFHRLLVTGAISFYLSKDEKTYYRVNDHQS